MSKQKQVTKKHTREQNARIIYSQGLVRSLGSDFYSVSSQTDDNKEYCVNVVNNTCSCKDSEIENTCKHFYVVQYYRAEKIRLILTQVQVKAVSKVGVVQRK